PSEGGAGASTAGAPAGGDAGDAGAAGSGSEEVEDPAPFADEPGETESCEGAPDTNLSVFELTNVSTSATTFSGVVTGAVGAGQYCVQAGTQAIAGPIDTSGTGAFEVTLPLFCGEQLVKLVWTNGECVVAAVTRVVRIDCATEDIRLTLSWDDLGDDFELHLI